MTITTVAQALGLDDKTPIPAIKGRIDKVWPRRAGTKGQSPYSYQEAKLKDATGEIVLKFSGHEDVKAFEGQDVYILAGTGREGEPIGVFRKTETFRKDGKTEAKDLVMVTQNGTISQSDQAPPANARPGDKPPAQRQVRTEAGPERTFWVASAVDQSDEPKELPESAIAEMLAKGANIEVCEVGKQQWITPEEAGIQPKANPPRQQRPAPPQRATEPEPEPTQPEEPQDDPTGDSEARETVVKFKKLLAKEAAGFHLAFDAAVGVADGIRKRHGYCLMPTQIGIIAERIWVNTLRDGGGGLVNQKAFPFDPYTVCEFKGHALRDHVNYLEAELEASNARKAEADARLQAALQQ
jgi:hypothetical protein